ncbi:MAG: class I SAM-dependent methyltransferase [Candidatus Competibacteraceae bacterium]|nr:class I SAM-dependent methyltransferase [Candidatus Competibacteraceae bacterium]
MGEVKRFDPNGIESYSKRKGCVFFKRISMTTMFDNDLHEIDNQISQTPAHAIPQLLKPISLDVFGQLLLDVPPKYPNIKAFFPSMVPDAAQDLWAGAHGTTLLKQSTTFIKTLITGYTTITGNNMERSAVLDFGCGWGRIIRLLYKYTSYENIYAVDPWDKAIELCQQHRIKAHLAMSDYVPQTLPFSQKFELIYALSVFTHLSEKTMHTVFKTLRRYIAEAGVLVITIRPREYWNIYKQGAYASDMIEIHDKKGFAFLPHNLHPIDGDITYGETSVTLDYLTQHFPQWKLLNSECNKEDPYQVILFFQPT